MNDNKVIFVLIDALRSDYITEQDSPFLYNFAKNNRYFRHVTQSRSFCERSEIFTGLSPRESGYFSAIGFCPTESPFKDIKILFFLSFFERFFDGNRYYKAIRNRMLHFFTRKKQVSMKSYSIPSKILDLFSLTEDKYDFRDKNAFDGRENLFKDCRDKNIKIFYDSFTALNFTKVSSDDMRLEMVEDNITSDYNLYMLYIGVMDSCAHKYGPKSNERKSELRKLDAKLSDFFNNINLKVKGVKFIFLGDHGMADVLTKIDVGQEVNSIAVKNGLILGDDYAYFLDSTMLRVWYFNDKAKITLENELRSNLILRGNGVFVDEKIAIEEEIPFPDKRYGDTLWLANMGVLIFPDFFHTDKPYKGMHGYNVDDISSKGTCIVSSDNPEYINNIKLTDVYSILKRELKIN